MTRRRGSLFTTRQTPNLTSNRRQDAGRRACGKSPVLSDVFRGEFSRSSTRLLFETEERIRGHGRRCAGITQVDPFALIHEYASPQSEGSAIQAIGGNRRKCQILYVKKCDVCRELVNVGCRIRRVGAHVDALPDLIIRMGGISVDQRLDLVGGVPGGLGIVIRDVRDGNRQRRAFRLRVGRPCAGIGAGNGGHQVGGVQIDRVGDIALFLFIPFRNEISPTGEAGAGDVPPIANRYAPGLPSAFVIESVVPAGTCKPA